MMTRLAAIRRTNGACSAKKIASPLPMMWSFSTRRSDMTKVVTKRRGKVPRAVNLESELRKCVSTVLQHEKIDGCHTSTFVFSKSAE